MCMYDSQKNEKKSAKNSKGDEDMVMIKEKDIDKKSQAISRNELREKLIRETIKKNNEALKRLSRT